MAIQRVGADVHVRAVGPVQGRVRPPGSKSLTNRYLACTALADGRSVLLGPSFADDAMRMLDGLRALGVNCHVEPDAQRIVVSGCRGHLPASDADIDVAGAGTAMRFLTALATLGYGRYRLDGSPRMRQRPIGQLVEGLRALGATVAFDAREGCPPLSVLGRGLAGGEVCFAAPVSSQFISALLMVAPYAARDVFVRLAGDVPSEPYIAMTLSVMRSMGVDALEAEGRRFIVPAGQRYVGGMFEIEPDASAATYFWAAAAITGGTVGVVGLPESSTQGDVRFAGVLRDMGCTVRVQGDALEVQGPGAGRLRGIDVDLNAMPDTVQTLAVIALFADGPTSIRNVANLRVKETDRLAALATELRRVGARVDVAADGLVIHPPARPSAAEIRTYDDHRMAMSFALLGLAGEGVVIRDAACVTKSFPRYFEALESLVGTQ